MRHYAFALLAAASMLFCACAKEEQTTENIRKSITASIDGNSLTRAAVRNVDIVWTDDDAIRVFNADGTASEVWNISSDDSGLETARISVTGGRFYKFNPADNLADGTGTNYVPSGYVSTADGDWFTVSEE